jgi:hypothetical protein
MAEIQGVLALYDGPEAILEAARATRESGYKKWDVFTPFPVHGMDDAMGLGRSIVPWITFCAGVIGALTGVGIQMYTMTMSWPQNYGGKPFLAWPAFVPITFETTVFVAGVVTAIASLFIGGVLRPKKRKLDPSITNDRFALFIDAADPKFDEKASRSMLEKFDPVEVRLVQEVRG